MARKLSAGVRGVVVVALLGLSACSRKAAPDMSAPSQAAAAVEPGGGTSAPVSAAAKDAVAKGAALPATSRKVIRNAELAMVVASPTEAETTISQMVERLGGYIASSDHQAVSDSEARANLSLRVPVAHMEEALREIKKLSVGLANEKIGSDDVTDEYIDLAAHITNQQALEKQLATILAQASSVDGALKVHHELAGVRTEIDRLQGRQRFLESESALAKISVALAPKVKPPQIMAVAPVTFADNLRQAIIESAAVAKALTSGIVIFGIQAAGILLPLALLFGLPALAVAWLARKRYKRLTATLSA
jgi:hypothetical protein